MNTLRPHLDRVRAGLLRFTDLLAPRLCAGCLDAIGHNSRKLCLKCWTSLAENISSEYCHRCGSESGPHLLIDDCCTACREKRAGRIRFNGFVRVGRYSGVLRELILRFKSRCVLDDLLGGLLAEALRRELGGESVDHWTPIPSHWRRVVRRRFQPTRLLAERAVEKLQFRSSRLLVMTRYVDQFHSRPGLSLKQRQDEVRGAFGVSPGFDLTGRTVCIIDDVCTTGATLAEAARTLKAAGAQRVFAAVLARADRSAARLAMG